MSPSPKPVGERTARGTCTFAESLGSMGSKCSTPSRPPGGSPLSSHRATLPTAYVVQSRPGNFIEELLFVGPQFDPTAPAVKASMLDKLGVAHNATVVQMRQEGGLNEGMWVLTSTTGSLILKLVPHERRHRIMPSEAEQFVKLARDHPAMIDDASLTFPIKIFNCRDQGHVKPSFDLVVMRKAPGFCFSQFIGRRWFANRRSELMAELYALGVFLADVHARHNMQHGDFTPSNVFYDETTRTFTMVDLSDFGPQMWDSPENDVERFSKGLQMVSRSYGEQFYLEGRPRFEAGYKERRAALGLNPSP